MFFYSFLACVFGRFLCSFLQILATFCATSLWLFLVFFWWFFTFFCLFLWWFFVAFWLHFWRFLHAFLTSFGGSVSRPAIGEESAHAFLVSRQSFHTKNVFFCFSEFYSRFHFVFAIFRKKGKMHCNQKNIKKNETKKTTKTWKNKEKTVGATQKSISSSKVSLAVKHEGTWGPAIGAESAHLRVRAKMAPQKYANNWEKRAQNSMHKKS